MHSPAAELLGPHGPFAQHVDGFAPRPQQQRMAEAIEQALLNNEVLVAEAGTGTGKTYAYLVPTMLSHKKTIVSTGTRNLQDQLFHKDLPLVRKALGIPLQATVLKGRSNYLCRHRLNLAETETQNIQRSQQAELIKITEWAVQTHSGDIAEVINVPEGSSIWPKVTSTADNCLGQDCPQFGDCFLVKARRKALDADVVIINHHLLCADMVIKESGFGEVLPSADAFILDEAHQLPEVASHFFGLSLSSRQLIELARDSRVEQMRDAADFAILADYAAQLEKATADMRLALGQQQRRAPWQQVAGHSQVISATTALIEALQALNTALQEAAVRGKGLESCQVRCESLLLKLQQFTQTNGQNKDEEADHEESFESSESAAQPRQEEEVQWFETHSRSFSLNSTPLEVGANFRARMSQYQSSWIFTSATLAVGEDFSHFNQRMGLQQPDTLLLESPFDYARNAVLYHPKDLPEPSAAHYNEAVLQASLPVLEASRGRAFILFTSHQALREAAEWLEGKLEYPLLVQGDLPKSALLNQFRDLGNAVLLGTASFWEGVDVRGDTLSCVIIAKLPFASPGDPILQARIAALRRQGANPFMEHQLPQAVIALKQGVGRLIRDIEDRGVLMLCDPRLLNKSYGQIFLDSLPPMIRTRNLAKVSEFFQKIDAQHRDNLEAVD